MIREDYLLRVIRQAVLLLLGSRRQRAEARLEDALSDLDEGARRLLGVDTRLLATLPEALLRDVVAPSGEVDEGRAVAVALLLDERAAVLRALSRADEADAAEARRDRFCALAGAPDLEALVARVQAGEDGQTPR